MTRRVALVTCRDLPDLTADDRLLLPELRARGFLPEPVFWDDDGADWRAFDSVVVRSTWDYYRRPVEFLAWLDRLEACGARVFNPVPVLRRNAHKGYLRELAAAGIAIVPTVWIARGARRVLAELLDEHGWPRAVVKPAVSAGAFQTWAVDDHDAAQRQDELDALVDAGDVLVQRYLEEVATEGEWSMIFLGGAYSHAVLKQPRDGDFRVQAEHGGSTASAEPSPGLLEQCRRIVGRIDGPWLYARVDGVVRDGTFLLMELELIEPELFFLKDPRAAGRLADALSRLAARASPG